MQTKQKKNISIFRVSSLLMMLFIFSLNLSAQKKENIDGKTYYVHIVKKGHTVYGISKQYAVDINLLYENNPTAESGISIGERILIPYSKVKQKKLKSAPKYNQDGLVHKVRKKETLYSISNKYDIDINELIARNPGAESGIVKGDMLVIPVEKTEGVKAVDIEPAKELDKSKHIVLAKETLYGIAKSKNISVEELSEANNGFPQGLKVGSIINVPSGDSNSTDPNSQETETPDGEERISEIIEGVPMEDINIGLLLPFSFNLIDTTAVPSAGGSSYRMTDIAMEFYRGVQIALNERKGMNVNLFVYDVTRNETGVKKFLLKKEVKDLDVILGPLHGSAFNRISKALKSEGVHFISPMTKSDNIIQNNPLCSKVLPSYTSHSKLLAAKTYEREKTTQLVVIDSEKEKDKELLNGFIAEYKQLSGKKPIVVKLSKYNQNSIAEHLMMDIPNLIVVPSTNRPFVSDFFTRLSDPALKKFDVELYGIESWLKYDNISAVQKNKYKLRLSASRFFDYEDEKTKEFMKKFYKEFKAIPVSEGYGILGYDIANFYLNGIYDYGDVFLDHLDQERVEGLFTGFDFEKLPNGGWMNNYKFILRYDDFDIIRE